MIINTNIVGIIADDLTGANDTALQFLLNGADTKILLTNDISKKNEELHSQAWAISTESRNISPQEAFERVHTCTKLIIDKINPDYLYKKIDSTMRGNIATEVMAALETLGWDCAVIMPAFPQEGRITVGGYQLLKGIPLERTEMAQDPHSPITESHLPTLLKLQLGESLKNLVGTIELKDVLDGAGPILLKITELIKAGKKIIIADSSSVTDLEQIALAIQKSNYNILPVGNASGAKVFSNLWFKDKNITEERLPIKLPNLPKLIISGSATQITANQVKNFENDEEYKYNSCIIKLDSNTILNGVQNNLVESILSNLNSGKIVLVHTSELVENFDGFSQDNADAELTKAKFASMITDFLAELTKKVLEKQNAVLITLGGETSYKCCDAIGADQLSQLDEVLPAIAISKNIESGQYIITKSGNLGNLNIISDILGYLKKHEE